jgi:ERF superfamily
MERSASIKELAKAMALFQMKISPIKKDSKNPFFKSSYASLYAIIEGIQVPLAECGLSFSQFPTGENGLTTILMHESGEFIQADYTMKPQKDDPQGRGSAITYQRRYALGAVLGLSIDEDDDANAASTPSQQNAPAANGPDKWLNKWVGKDQKETTKEWKGAVEKLTNKTTTVEKIAAAFKLSKELRAELENIAK